MVFNFTVLPSSLIDSSILRTWEIRVCISHLATHTFTYTDLLFIQRNFSLLPYIFNHILCEQIERFDLPMALVMRSSNIKLQMSSFTPQDVERKAKLVLNTNKKVLPSR